MLAYPFGDATFSRLCQGQLSGVWITTSRMIASITYRVGKMQIRRVSRRGDESIPSAIHVPSRRQVPRHDVMSALFVGADGINLWPAADLIARRAIESRCDGRYGRMITVKSAVER